MVNRPIRTCMNVLSALVLDVIGDIELSHSPRRHHWSDSTPHPLVSPRPVPQPKAPEDPSDTIRITSIERPLVIQVEQAITRFPVARRPQQHRLAPEHSWVIVHASGA